MCVSYACVSPPIPITGLRLRNLDAVGLKHVFGLLQQHYVEVLAQLIMVGAPSLFWGVWRIVSPFIDPATRAKVKFVEAADSSSLMQELGPEVSQSGGQCSRRRGTPHYTPTCREGICDRVEFAQHRWLGLHIHTHTHV